MVNDTDYTVWRERGVPGLNFAFIGDVTRYHTPLDDFEHLAPSSLQHHASNALSAVRALDRAVFPIEAGGEVTTRGPDAVFFDLAGRKLVTLQVKALRMLAALTLLLALVGVGRGVASGRLRGPRVALGIAAVPATLVAALLLVRLDGGLMALLGAATVSQPAHPGPIITSLVAMTIGGLALACGALGRTMRAAEAGAAVLLLHAFGGLFLSWTVPGAAFLLVFPVLALAIAASLMRMRGNLDARWGRAGVFALGVSAVLWTPLHAGVIDAFGVGNPLVVAVPLLVTGSFALPVMVRSWSWLSPWVAAAGLSLALLAGVFASTRPTHSPERPGRVNLVHIQEGDEPARWQVMGMRTPLGDEVTAVLEAALGIPGRETRTAHIPWSTTSLFAARAQRLDVEMPIFEITQQVATPDGNTLVEGRVRSPRGGDQLVLELGGVQTMRVAGEEVDPVGFAFLAPDPAGQSFALELAPDRKIFVGLYDKRFGLEGPLTSRARSFFAARPVNLVPSHDGDGSLLISRYVLRCDEDGLVTLMESKAEEEQGDDPAVAGDDNE